MKQMKQLIKVIQLTKMLCILKYSEVTFFSLKAYIRIYNIKNISYSYSFFLFQILLNLH